MSNELSNIPSYLSSFGGNGEGAEQIELASATPRLGIVHGTSRKETRLAHPDGSLIVRPDMQLLAAPGEMCAFHPVYQWVSWQKWADVNDTESQARILEESTDPGSDLAARSRSFELRREPYGSGKKQLYYGYFESVNMILQVAAGHPMSGLVVAASWRSAGHKHGARLSRHITFCGTRGLPIYAHRVEIGAVLELANTGQEYLVLGWRHPASGGLYTPEAQLPGLRELYRAFSDRAARASITPDE